MFTNTKPHLFSLKNSTGSKHGTLPASPGKNNRTSQELSKAGKIVSSDKGGVPLNEENMQKILSNTAHVTTKVDAYKAQYTALNQKNSRHGNRSGAISNALLGGGDVKS